MSTVPHDVTAGSMPPPPPAASRDDERPPACPTCSKRLVLIASHWTSDERGEPLRRQMWGCPRGHSTAYRHHGVFTAVELLDELI